ncbi:hypothetical protein WA158_002887 [Blastocystis sp. Blastoise]
MNGISPPNDVITNNQMKQEDSQIANNEKLTCNRKLSKTNVNESDDLVNLSQNGTAESDITESNPKNSESSVSKYYTSHHDAAITHLELVYSPEDDSYILRESLSSNNMENQCKSVNSDGYKEDSESDHYNESAHLSYSKLMNDLDIIDKDSKDEDEDIDDEIDDEMNELQNNPFYKLKDDSLLSKKETMKEPKNLAPDKSISTIFTNTYNDIEENDSINPLNVTKYSLNHSEKKKNLSFSSVLENKHKSFESIDIKNSKGKSRNPPPPPSSSSSLHIKPSINKTLNNTQNISTTLSNTTDAIDSVSSIQSNNTVVNKQNNSSIQSNNTTVVNNQNNSSIQSNNTTVVNKQNNSSIQSNNTTVVNNQNNSSIQSNILHTSTLSPNDENISNKKFLKGSTKKSETLDSQNDSSIINSCISNYSSLSSSNPISSVLKNKNIHDNSIPRHNSQTTSFSQVLQRKYKHHFPYQKKDTKHELIINSKKSFKNQHQYKQLKEMIPASSYNLKNTEQSIQTVYNNISIDSQQLLHTKDIHDQEGGEILFQTVSEHSGDDINKNTYLNDTDNISTHSIMSIPLLNKDTIVYNEQQIHQSQLLEKQPISASLNMESAFNPSTPIDEERVSPSPLLMTPPYPLISQQTMSLSSSIPSYKRQITQNNKESNHNIQINNKEADQNIQVDNKEANHNIQVDNKEANQNIQVDNKETNHDIQVDNKETSLHHNLSLNKTTSDQFYSITNDSNDMSIDPITQISNDNEHMDRNTIQQSKEQTLNNNSNRNIQSSPLISKGKPLPPPPLPIKKNIIVTPQPIITPSSSTTTTSSNEHAINSVQSQTENHINTEKSTQTKNHQLPKQGWRKKVTQLSHYLYPLKKTKNINTTDTDTIYNSNNNDDINQNNNKSSLLQQNSLNINLNSLNSNTNLKAQDEINEDEKRRTSKKLEFIMNTNEDKKREEALEEKEGWVILHDRYTDMDSVSTSRFDDSFKSRWGIDQEIVLMRVLCRYMINDKIIMGYIEVTNDYFTFVSKKESDSHENILIHWLDIQTIKVDTKGNNKKGTIIIKVGSKSLLFTNIKHCTRCCELLKLLWYNCISEKKQFDITTLINQEHPLSSPSFYEDHESIESVNNSVSIEEEPEEWYTNVFRESDSMLKIVSTSLQTNVSDFFTKFIENSDFYIQLLLDAGDKDIQIGPWEVINDFSQFQSIADSMSPFRIYSLVPFSHTRTITFNHQLYILGKTLNVTVHQSHYYIISKTNKSACLFIDYSIQGFIYSTSFHVLTLWILEDHHDQLDITIFTHVHWLKQVLLSNKIEKTIENEVKDICQKWLTKCRDIYSSLSIPLHDNYKIPVRTLDDILIRLSQTEVTIESQNKHYHIEILLLLGTVLIILTILCIKVFSM